MRGIFLFYILALSLASTKVLAIDHQLEIKQAQEWVDSFDRSYPIVIIDRDKINFLIKSNSASNNEDLMFELVKDHFIKEFDVSIDIQDFINLEPYLNRLTNSAIALPINEGFSGEYKFCTVFANAPNGNSQVETNRLVGFNQPGPYDDHPDYNYNNLNEKMSFEELYLFSLYHEASHCLDQDFLIEMQQNGGEPHGIHEAETFAELMAYFALIPRLGEEVAARRALYRTIYSRVVGKYLTTIPSFGNPHVTSGGAIYNLGPYLYKAQELIHFQQISLDDPLDQLAKSFVLEHGLTSREFHAVVTFLRSGPEEANNQYKEWAFRDPQFFYSAYMELIQYQHYSDSLLEYAFTLKPSPEYDSLPDLNVNLICQLMVEKDLNGYLEVLNNYRSKINNGLYETEEITSVYDQLNNLSITCDL